MMSPPPQTNTTFTYVGIINLDLPKNWVRDQDAGSGFANEPVASDDINRRAVHRIRMNSRSYNGESRENDETCTQSTTDITRSVLYAQNRTEMHTCRRASHVGDDSTLHHGYVGNLHEPRLLVGL